MCFTCAAWADCLLQGHQRGEWCFPREFQSEPPSNPGNALLIMTTMKPLGHVYSQYWAAYLTEIGPDPGAHCKDCMFKQVKKIRDEEKLTLVGGWPPLVCTRNTSSATLPDTALSSSQSTSRVLSGAGTSTALLATTNASGLPLVGPVEVKSNLGARVPVSLMK